MIKQIFFYRYRNRYLSEIPRIVNELRKQGQQVLQIHAWRTGGKQ